MKIEILQEFIEETQRNLSEICKGITAYWQNPHSINELENSLMLTQTIKDVALSFGLIEINEISLAIEDEIKKIISSRNIITTKQNQFLLEQISRLEYLLILTAESADEICIEDDALNEEFFGALELDTSTKTFANEDFTLDELELTEENNSENFQPSEDDEFEIDEEMLEIFALEAEDHLRNIISNLALLESKPDDSNALLEIRRSAHTLKGSAGIIGFKKLSSLAHHVEDLLEYISDNEITSNKSVFELLMASTDCLEALANGQNSAELENKIAELYVRFDNIIELLQKTSAAEEILSKTEIAAQNPIREAITPIVQAISKEKPAEQTTDQPQSVSLPNRSVVRVSLERLDDLVKLVNEMIVSRSVFERRIIEFEQQIQELVQTTNRLRRSTGKLEIDFEASTLENRNSGFQSYNFAAAEQTSFFENKTQEFDTLEFDHYTEFHQTTRELIETAGDVSAIHNEFDNLLGNFGSLFDTQRRLVEEMQESLMRLRMVPLNSIAARLHRTVRVTASDENKLADLEIENGGIEIDTQILDAFSEPLLHLLRNAVAHGIESPEIRKQTGKPEKGKISVRAYSEGTHIVFVISDDGQGISASSLKEKAVSDGFITQKEADEATEEEAFSLIFLPGLSTAPKVNQVSGRGVGMNIVKSNIARRQGTISIKSELDKGTAFTIRLPMSLAVTRALLVKAKEQTFAFPLKIVKQIIEVSPAELEKINTEKVFYFNNVPHKFFVFNELVNVSSRAKLADSKTSILLVETSETPCALAVEQILKPEEIVIKPLGSLLRNVSELIGATIMGDGSVVPVLDLAYLIKDKEKTKNLKTEILSEIKDPATSSQPVSVLIVDDSPSVRHVNSKLIKNAGWQPLLAKDGLEALEILQNASELPRAIMTDVEMPRMDGYEFLASIKRQNHLREIPVIMITSRSGDKHRRKAYNLGVSAYLNKPFEESILIEKIRELTR